MTESNQTAHDLTRLADHGPHRGAASVLRDARSDAHRAGRRRTWSVRLAAAACLVLIASTVWVVRSGKHTGVKTTIGGGGRARTTGVPMKLPDLQVTGTNPKVLGLAFGRIWVSTIGDRYSGKAPAEAPTLLQTFDQATGKRKSSVELPGFAYVLAATDQSVYVRVTSLRTPGCQPGTGCGSPSTNLLSTEDLVLKVEPAGSVIGQVAKGSINGPLAATHDRIAFADTDAVTIVAEDGRRLGRTSIDEVVGPSPSPQPGMNFTSLAFSDNGKLVGVHRGPSVVVGMDATTAKHIAGESVGLGSDNAVLAAVGWGRAWISYDGASGRVLQSLPLELPLIGLGLRPFSAHQAIAPVAIQPAGGNGVVLLDQHGRRFSYHVDGSYGGVMSGVCGGAVVSTAQRSWAVQRCASGVPTPPTFHFVPLG